MWDGGWIRTERLNNARDLGGMPAAGGKTIRRGKLLRSGLLAEATEADLDCLVRDHALSTIVDLRGDEEIANVPDPVIKGVRYIKHPVLPSRQLGITREADFIDSAGQMSSGHDHMCHVYGKLIDEDQAIDRFRQFLKYVLEQKEGAILCHCTAGKDRTGIAVAIIQMGLGVPRDLILQDYLYTNICSQRAMDAVMAQTLLRTDDENTIGCIQDMMLAKEEYLNTFLAGMVAACGSTEAFLQERLGLDEETKARLQAMYLE